MAICECKNDVCYFKLSIEQQQTFTAYKKDVPMGTLGRLFYINDSNQLQSTLEDKAFLPCNSRNRDICTEPNTVDGSTFRSFISVNKRMPGPTIIVNEGATVVVDVFNYLVTEGTSIHWHGMHQRGTPWMDGVGFISQCPIQAGTSFRYIFKAAPSGTFWYHSHSGAQRSDGLFGALIVKEDKINIPSFLHNVLDTPRYHSITLLDWDRVTAVDLFIQTHPNIGIFEGVNLDEVPKDETKLYFATCTVDGAELGATPFWSGLAEGLGKHKNVEFTNANMKTFTVISGNTYRFRLIGAQALYAFRFSIDNHKLTLIATDGYFIEPIETDYLIIHAGERYDFLLKANQTPNNYLIRFETLEVNCSDLNRGSNLFDNDGIAVLTYNGIQIDYNKLKSFYANKNTKNCSESNTCVVTNCPFENYAKITGYTCVNVDKFKLLTPTRAEELPDSDSVTDDSTFFFNFGFNSDEITSTINGRNFILPSTSLFAEKKLLDEIKPQICTDTDNECKGSLCQCIHIVDLGESLYKKTVRFVLSSLDIRPTFASAHPVHLHGHTFHVVKVGYGKYDIEGKIIEATTDIQCESNCKKAPTWSSRPFISITNKTVRKDTVIVPGGGYVVIDVIADNPGYWFLHCHIVLHQLEGMALVISEVPSKHTSAPEAMPTCGNFKLTVEEFNKDKYESNGSNNHHHDAIIIVLGCLFGMAFFYAS